MQPRRIRPAPAGADVCESNVRYYSRHIPCTFRTGRNAVVVDEDGNRYIDFLSACGSLNYGHNHPRIKAPAVAYLLGDGMLNALDLNTTARRDFIAKFRKVVLEPRGLDYKLQFTGPTGTNAVEAALKLARKVTGRTTVAAFSNAFHGVSLGALAATGNRAARSASLALLHGVVRLPFDGYEGAGVDDLDRFEAMSRDGSGGIELPAAFIVETVQGEGGLNVASVPWLRRLAEVARRMGALLIVDDIQAGCGRTGPFFSFERAGITPDVVCLSKSLSGLGLPMSLVLLRPDCDAWAPGEHSGTFRGNNLAFVTAAAALDFWTEADFIADIARRASTIERWIAEIVAGHPRLGLRAKGLGMMRGVAFPSGASATGVARAAYDRGVLVETAGPRGEVLKLLPPLTIEADVLDQGLSRLADAIGAEAAAHDAERSTRAA
ncbi:MAG TPA: diaminobutyrate--2-oxoglutarate transaminase [Beijerinckiaceae bacterium]|jgi:diaminobutyrate-2-oxoglutarate transaminase